MFEQKTELKVLERLDRRPVGNTIRRFYRCECVHCGDIFETYFLNAKSCGCLKQKVLEAAKDRFKIHGKAQVSNVRSPLIGVRNNMIQRCYNPGVDSYQYYGAKGITVCDRWLNGEDGKTGFECFYDDMGERPSSAYTIDRIDPTGNYCPENCRWATQAEQARNRTNNLLIEYQGQIKCLSDWADQLGLSASMLYRRLSKGMLFDKAILYESGDLPRAMKPKLEKEKKVPKVIEYQGQTKTLQQWADQFGISAQVINYRLKKGLPLNEVFDPIKKPPGKGERTILFNGLDLPISGWAKRLGVSPKVMQRRLRDWPVEKALTQSPVARGSTSPLSSVAPPRGS